MPRKADPKRAEARRKLASWMRQRMSALNLNGTQVAERIGETGFVVRSWRNERIGPPVGKRLAALERVLGGSYKDAKQEPIQFNLKAAIAEFQLHVAENMELDLDQVVVTVSVQTK